MATMWGDEGAGGERNGRPMYTTPEAPINEQPAQLQQPMQAPVQQPIQQQPVQQQQPMWRPAAPPMGVYAPAPPTQAAYLTPTGGQRMGLAIASLALLIPLLAIASGVMTSLLAHVASGVAITIGLIAITLVCLVVVAINVLFNWDILSRRR